MGFALRHAEPCASVVLPGEPSLQQGFVVEEAGLPEALPFWLSVTPALLFPFHLYHGAASYLCPIAGSAWKASKGFGVPGQLHSV